MTSDGTGQGVSLGDFEFTMYGSQKAQIFLPFLKTQAPDLLGPIYALPKNTSFGPGLGPDKSLISRYLHIYLVRMIPNY